MITIINGRKKTNQDLQVHLCEAMISLSGEVRLGKQVLRLSGAKFDQEWSGAHLGFKDLRLGGDYRAGAEMGIFALFHQKFPTKTNTYQNISQTQLKLATNTFIRIFPTQA